MPVFIGDIETVDDVIDDFSRQLNTHPDIVLILQKINSNYKINVVYFR